MRYLKEATAAATSGVLKIHCACGVLGPWVCQRPLGFWVLNPVSRAPGAIGFLGPPTTQDPRGFIWKGPPQTSAVRPETASALRVPVPGHQASFLM